VSLPDIDDKANIIQATVFDTDLPLFLDFGAQIFVLLEDIIQLWLRLMSK